MAKDAADSVTWYLVVAQQHRDDLANIRQWEQLKVGMDDGRIWVKDFDYAQINSVEVKSIPYKKIFYASEGKLFLQGSRLPDRNIPSLLWTAIERALPIVLPDFNHNYFGVQGEISVSLMPTDKEIEAVAMMTSMDALGQYIANASAVRLQPLVWAILNRDKVMIFGTPLLPIDGHAYWQRDNHIIPAGMDFDLYLLSDALNDSIDKERLHWIVWNTNGTYFLIDKHDLQPLSAGSYRKSMQEMAVL